MIIICQNNWQLGTSWSFSNLLFYTTYAVRVVPFVQVSNENDFGTWSQWVKDRTFSSCTNYPSLDFSFFVRTGMLLFSEKWIFFQCLPDPLPVSALRFVALRGGTGVSLIWDPPYTGHTGPVHGFFCFLCFYFLKFLKSFRL